MAILEVLLVIALGVLAVLLFDSAIQHRQQQSQMENAFYQLLEDQDSCISLIQLAAAARVGPKRARQYLERQVQMLEAVPEVDADGDTFYRFPKLRLRPYSEQKET